MRSSILFASALVAGALARPHLNLHLRKKGIITEVAVEVVTVEVIVTVTAGNEQATSTSSCISTTATPVSTPPAVPSSSASSQPPIRTPASKAEARPESSAPPKIESQPVVPSSTSSALKPQPTAKPSTTAAPVPSPAPSPEHKQEPKPEPVSSSEVAAAPSPKPDPKPAPAPSPSPEHKSAPAPAPSPDPQPSTPTDDHLKGPEEAYLSSGPEYVAAMLYHHNAARANHAAEPLTWDDACEANARIAAQKCNFGHFIPEGAGQGQNLFTVSGDAFNATAGITESWYKGELEPMLPYFGDKDVPDDVFHEVGHLTQVVWKGTTKIGCVSIDCGDKMIVGGAASSMNKYTVCNYAPAGNVFGGYRENVVRPISLTNLGGWAD